MGKIKLCLNITTSLYFIFLQTPSLNPLKKEIDKRIQAVEENLQKSIKAYP